MGREGRGGRLRIRPWMVTVAVPLLAYLSLHIGTRAALQRQGWFDSWAYTTRADRELGYRLRANVANRFGGTEVYINEQGLRSAPGVERVPPKQAGELRIVTLGDSNVFGVSTRYELTYPALLQQELGKQRHSAVRVINAAAPGYSLVQSLLTLKRLSGLGANVVVASVNSANDRCFIGRPDSPYAFARDAAARNYEFGDYISYPILYWSRLHPAPSLMSSARPLSWPLPPCRVPLPSYSGVIQELVAETKRQGAKLILVSTGESTDSPWVEEGLVALRERQLDRASAAFERAQAEQPGVFLPAFHAYNSALDARDPERAALVERRYHADFAKVVDHYSDNLAFAAAEYEPLIQRLLAQLHVPFLNLRRQFRTAGITFDNGHFDAAGHRLVATALTEAVQSLVDASASPDPASTVASQATTDAHPPTPQNVTTTQ